ncbi:MAG TPA: hypothetical protein VFS43_29700 [Polyangiaceae bacterium]|nr:hypothetical protein [Polyangiaceae bacterium]
MGLLDKLLGRPTHRQPPPAFHHGAPGRYAPARRLTEDQAIARYRYLLRTAPPEAIEKVHQEAFARLTPEQRSQVLRDLASRLPHYERDAFSYAGTDPHTLARLATRAEMREPGIMDRMLGRWGSPSGMGGMGGMGGGMSLGTSLLGSFAAGFAGSLLANQLYDVFHDGGGAEGVLGDADGFQGGSALEPDAGDAGQETVGADYDPGASDYDAGADADFDGGDFGGGDLGGDLDV